MVQVAQQRRLYAANALRCRLPTRSVRCTRRLVSGGAPAGSRLGLTSTEHDQAGSDKSAVICGR